MNAIISPSRNVANKLTLAENILIFAFEHFKSSVSASNTVRESVVTKVDVIKDSGLDGVVDGVVVSCLASFQRSVAWGSSLF